MRGRRLNLPGFGLILLGIASLLVSIYIFLNAYEVAFNRDIPFIGSLSRVEAQSVVNGVVSDLAVKPNSSDANYSQIKKFDYFEIPALKLRVYTEEARKIGATWYQRPSTAHYIELNKSLQGVVVDYLLYTNQSWRTIAYPDQIEKGMEVKFYYQNGSSTSFEVAEKTVKPIDRSFVVAQTDNRQILLLVEDSSNHKYFGFSLVPSREK